MFPLADQHFVAYRLLRIHSSEMNESSCSQLIINIVLEENCQTEKRAWICSMQLTSDFNWLTFNSPLLNSMHETQILLNILLI